MKLFNFDNYSDPEKNYSITVCRMHMEGPIYIFVYQQKL